MRFDDWDNTTGGDAARRTLEVIDDHGVIELRSTCEVDGRDRATVSVVLDTPALTRLRDRLTEALDTSTEPRT